VNSRYTLLRAAEAPDFTGDAPGAFYGYGRPLGSEQLAVNLRVLEPGTAHVPPGGDPALAVKVDDQRAESQPHEEFWT
jgi:hypothetical protein